MEPNEKQDRQKLTLAERGWREGMHRWISIDKKPSSEMRSMTE